MTNAFYMQCELDQGKEILYHTRAPYWCDWHSQTESFEIDFANFDKDGFGNVSETATVIDSIGNAWAFNGSDPDYHVGYYDDFLNPCPGSLILDTNRLSNHSVAIPRPLVLAPQGIGPGTWGGIPPRFNRNYGWTIMIEGSAAEGLMTWQAEAGEPDWGESPDWGHDTEATIYGDWPVANHGQFNWKMSGPCKKGAPNVEGVDIRYRWATWVCVCHILRVEPCEHKLDQIVRVTNMLAPGVADVFFWDGIAIRNPDTREKSFSLRCDDWWKIDALDPWWRGTYQPSQTAETAGIPPPNLLGDFSHDQRMRFTFGSTGPSAGTELYLRKFRMFDHYLSDAEIDAICTVAP